MRADIDEGDVDIEPALLDALLRVSKVIAGLVAALGPLGEG